MELCKAGLYYSKSNIRNLRHRLSKVYETTQLIIHGEARLRPSYVCPHTLLICPIALQR